MLRITNAWYSVVMAIYINLDTALYNKVSCDQMEATKIAQIRPTFSGYPMGYDHVRRHRIVVVPDIRITGNSGQKADGQRIQQKHGVVSVYPTDDTFQ